MEKLARPYNISTCKSRVRPPTHTHTHTNITQHIGYPPNSAPRHDRGQATFTFGKVNLYICVYLCTYEKDTYFSAENVLFIYYYFLFARAKRMQTTMYTPPPPNTNTSSGTRPERHKTGKAYDISS